MKSLYCALAALLIVGGSANALDVKSDTPLGGEAEFSSRIAYSCDDNLEDNAFLQNQGSTYGNRFSVAGGPLSSVEFAHFGWDTQVGPYDFNLKVLDGGTCTEVASLALQASDAFSGSVTDFFDLCDENISVSGDIFVGVDPLSCAAPNDCYPDVWFETTAPVNSCGSVASSATGAGCDTPVQSSAGPVDFLLRITVDECGSTPTVEHSWGNVKGLYR